MMKKVLALVLVLTLALGALAVTATADDADDINYQVGYSKVDINPYWSIWEATGGTIPTDKTNYATDRSGRTIGSDHLMPLPMGGYGGNTSRLSRPELVDDNGSGVHQGTYSFLKNNRYTQAFAKEMLGDGTAAYNAYAKGGFGQNDGDGIYATCVSIRQNGSAEPILYFSVDFIGMSDVYCGQAKMQIINALKAEGISINPDRILINATHTHGSISLGESFESSESYTQKLYGYTSSNAANRTVTYTGSELSNYLSAYKKHLYVQLAEAAVKAVKDGQKGTNVTMEKGTIDVSDATGYQLNGVRHDKAVITAEIDGEEKEVQYVTGSSFNVSLKSAVDGEAGKKTEAVSESDDSMHILKFSFPETSGLKPILMINWRAHTTANNKMGSLVYNSLSADFVAAMRYKLEQWGYRPILIYGASGNLGMADTPGTFNIKFEESYSTLAGTAYGRVIAFAAAYLAGSSHAEVNQMRSDLLDRLLENSESDGDVWSEAYLKMSACTPVLNECKQGKILLESIPYSVTPQTSSNAGYAAALYHHALARSQGKKDSDTGGLQLAAETPYPYLVNKSSPAIVTRTETTSGTKTTTTVTSVTYEKKVVTVSEYNSSTGKTTTKTDTTTYNVETDGFVLASQYHAKSLINRHGDVNKKRISLTAFTLGEEVAFATVPFEASDRYADKATLISARAENAQNDWDNLAVNSATKLPESWGTPFVVSLVNGTEGYVPNYLAYTYQGVVDGKDHNLEADYINGKTKTVVGGYDAGFVNGCYEANTAYAAQGQGEAIVAELDNLLEGLSDKQTTETTRNAYCEACGETVVWSTLPDSKQMEDWGNNLPAGHYFLDADYNNYFGAMTIYLDQKVCLDLNGYTLYADSDAGGRAFGVYDVLNVMDSVGGGVLKSDGNAGNGGVVYVGALGVFNLYSGTITCTNEYPAENGGCVYVPSGGTFNMYGGTITGGKATTYGGNVDAQDGVFNMYGGTITDGKINNNSTAAYANLMISAKASFRYNGGSIPSGAFMQGTLYLGADAVYPVSADEAVIDLRNYAKVILDGVFTGKVNLIYSNLNADKTDYPIQPVLGDTVGEVKPGAWIDHANGAQIMLSGVTNYEGIVSDENLVVGERPAIGYCEACKANVVWTEITSDVTSGHYSLNGDYTATGTVSIPSGSKLCLNLNGATYTATSRAFTVTGTLNIIGTNGGVLQGTAVSGKNGGTVYVNGNGTVNQYGGTLSCVSTDSTKIANGGVVYVLANGNYNLYGGTISGGKASTGGGNVYDCGRFTMYGGTITGGNAGSYGGNVHVQGSSAVFTIKGGTISNGTSDIGPAICTGPNGSTSTSVLRIEGGKINGMIYVQGLAVLTGATDEAVNVKMRTKPDERLTIEGTYTGTLNLAINGVSSVAADTKIGISNGADISEATIQVNGAADGTYVAVVNNDLMLLEDVATSISVTTYPTKTYYDLGEELDTTGLVVTVLYASGKTEEITAATEGVVVTGYDAQQAGSQTLRVDYEGMSDTFDVFVKAMNGIAIGKQPNKTTYDIGEELNTAGLKLTVSYNDSTTAEITEGFTVTGYNAQQAGEQTLTVTYEGFTTTFTVFVKVQTGITVNTLPGKTSYILGEELNTAGLKLTVSYNDGSEEIVTEGFTVTGYDAQQVGEQILTVTYEDVTTTFTVTVNEVLADYVVNGEGYDDLNAAIAASSAEYPVVLNKDVEIITLTQNAYIDLNGHTVLAVADNEHKLYCMDSVTDNFEATEGWGTAPKQANVVAANDYRKVADGFDMIEGYAAGVKYYLAMDEGDGRQSFHQLKMYLHTVNVDVEQKGISYTATFQGDAKIKANIKEFGIAMRAYTAPNQTSVWADVDGKTHVAKTGNDWMKETSLTGVDVVGILAERGNPNNAARANVEIYGSCYIQFTDGTMLFSPKLDLTLNEVMNLANNSWKDLGADEQESLIQFYKDYEDAFDATWMPVIAAKAKEF